MIEKHLPDKVLLLGYWSSVVEIIKNLLWISLIESKTKEISENVYQDLYSIARDFFLKKVKPFTLIQIYEQPCPSYL